MSIVLLLIYFIIFCFAIIKLNVFRKSNIPIYLLISLFTLKFCAGMGLNAIYSKYYTDKSTSDIYKYYYDGEALHDIAFKSPTSFIKLMYSSGTQDSTTQSYASAMKNWRDKDPSYLKVTNSKETDIFNSQRTIIRVNALFRFVSMGSIATHTLFMCFIAFLGQILLFRAFIQFNPKRIWALIFAIFLIPSALIWTSGILKECIIYLGLGLFTIQLLNRNSHLLKKTIYIVFAIVLLLFSKSYLAVLVAIAAFTYLHFENYKHDIKKLIVFTAISGIIVIIVLFIIPTEKILRPITSRMQNEKHIAMGGYYLSNLNDGEDQKFFEESYFNSLKIKPHNKDEYAIPAGARYYKYYNGEIFDKEQLVMKDNCEHYLMLSYVKAGSYIPIPNIKPTWKSFFSFAPLALKNILLEPIITKSKSLLTLISSIENMIILMILIFGIIFYKQNPKYNSVAISNVTFALLLMALVAYTTPIAGNLMRYKTPAITFLMITIAFSYDETALLRIKDKIKQK